MPLADTSFVTGLMRRDPGALALYNAYKRRGTGLQTTAVTALELYKGAFLSGSEKNRSKAAALLELFTVIPVDETVYEMSGRIPASLSQRGDAIGDFDEVIAAIALSYDGEIITRDRHFSKVPGLVVIPY